MNTKTAPKTGDRQSRGPLGPGCPEVTVYSTLVDGRLSASPPAIPGRPRPVAVLVTDDASRISAIPHNIAVIVDEKGHRRAMLDAHFAARRRDSLDRTIAVAGSEEMVSAAVDDAWRIVLECEADAEMPFAISEWRHSRTKTCSVTTLTREAA